MKEKKKMRDWLKELDYFILEEVDLDEEVGIDVVNKLVKDKKIIKMKYGF